MAVWRLQVNTGEKNIAEYCITEHVAAMGWSLCELSKEGREKIKTFDDYQDLAKAQYPSIRSVYRLAKEVNTGDILWMRSRSSGKYYFARVKPESKWIFNEEATVHDAANQLSNIDWYQATDKADEESVPGAIATAFIKGATLQRINKPGVEEYSQMLFNRLHDSTLDQFDYPNPQLSLCEENFYSLLQPEDVEDLLSLWLYDTKQYVCIPSTNKVSTPKYECVLIDPNDHDRKHIYIQVKKGKANLDVNDYTGLAGEVYLLTTEGEVYHSGDYANIHAVDPSVIYQFAINADKAHMIPENVLYWVKFLTEMENATFTDSESKGIMFDTNRSYSDNKETEMLRAGKIAAYGNAARYVDSLKKGDYALFYSKGRGIIAIGEVTSEHSICIGNERNHIVKMVVPEGKIENVNNLPAIKPNEIKELLDRNFYWASTIKTPFLRREQVEVLINALKKKHA